MAKKKPQKQVLKSLELTTLLVALDHLEEYGPSMAIADPYEKPAECVYLKFIGDAQLKALTDRIPYRNVRFNTFSGKVVRQVFNKAAIVHLMEFSFPQSKAYKAFIHDLKSINETYWHVLDAEGKTIKRPRKEKAKGKGASKK